MRKLRFALLFALGLALAFTSGACQSAPAPQPPRTAAPQADPLAEARAAMDRGEYERALGLLRRVVATRSDSLEAHFRLGVSASYLDLFDETSREFQWVVTHADGSPEAQIARQWLNAGTEALAPDAPPPTESNPERASLSGVAMAGDGVPRPLVRHKISLKGMKPPVLETAYDVRTDQDGRFAFRDVVPGEYMLTDSLSGQTTWRLRLTLKRGERATFDLTPDNSTRTRDDFPESSS